ncbi:MAG: SufD family Fe-S cluster assembly protein, partial [Paenibacillus sp.]|nr:SufD family Fe-S cluster assembly protein [Paenibacillus sp.]
MSTEIVLPVDREAVAALSNSKNEPAWLAELRLQALETAVQLDNPKPEKTKIDRWNLDAYGTASTNAKVAQFSELPEAVQEVLRSSEDSEVANVLVQVDSNVIYTQLAEELKQQGVIFTDLETAAREHEELVKPHLMQAMKADEHRVAALHAALWNGGVFLYVPRNVEVSIPLQALFYQKDSAARFAPHVLIVADTNSRVHYVDTYISSETTEASVHNGVVEVFVKPGAKVTYASIHHMSKETVDLSYRRAVVEQDGGIEWIVGEMHNGNTISDTT